MLIKPSKQQATLKSKKWISSKVLEVTFIPNSKFKFLPGHFINLNIPEVAYRSYSISSDPKNKNEFQIIVSAKHKGPGANYLRNLESGETVNFIGPSGKFLFSSQKSKNIVFLATGTGIAPFLTMLYNLKHTKAKSKIHLYWGLRDESEIFYIELLNNFKTTLNFDYTICLSKPSKKWQEHTGRITNHYEVSYPRTVHVYLCGNPSMVDELLPKLIDQGVKPENIFYEKFTHSEN